MSQRIQRVKSRRGDKDVSIDRRRLRRRRLAAGLTVTELAARAGCSKGYVSKLENGYPINPEATMLAALAGALECEIADLMPPEPVASGRGAA